jgi:hypothetical protein
MCVCVGGGGAGIVAIKPQQHAKRKWPTPEMYLKFSIKSQKNLPLSGIKKN